MSSSTDKIKLLGPEPPATFLSDGCTMSPDGWWVRACRIHDYEYEQIRELITERDRVVRGHFRKYLTKEIKEKRKEVDKRLKINIKLLSRKSRTKRLFAWWISRRYYGAVRRWGWLAIRGPGHQDKG